MSVRIAVEADGKAIGEAHAAAWLAAYDHIFEPAFLAAAAASRRGEWPRVIGPLLVPPNVLLVGALGQRVVAFAHVSPVTVRNTAEIKGFYCHPDAWGSGVAAALMDEVRGLLAREFNDVFLWTLRDAARARRFYEKVGFRLTGGERDEPLTDWTTGVAVTRPAVEYAARLPNDC
jgi:GNAT superfamily N-acetyltransferase